MSKKQRLIKLAVIYLILCIIPLFIFQFGSHLKSQKKLIDVGKIRESLVQKVQETIKEKGLEQSISKLVFDKKSFGLTTGDRDCLKVGDVVMGYRIVEFDSNKVILVDGNKKIELLVDDLFVTSFE